MVYSADKRQGRKWSGSRRVLVVVWFLTTFSLFFVSGCVSLKETGKQIWGSSISHLECARSEGKSQEIPLSLAESFQKTEKILKGMGATVYLKDEKYMAAMNFQGHVDTTEVGIFFTKIEERLTRVEVASMSPELVQQVADILFAGLKEK